MKLYTIWAALKEDPESVWMLYACDEYSYEGDPDARDADFAAAKASCEKDDHLWREITITLDVRSVVAAFVPAEVAAVSVEKNG